MEKPSATPYPLYPFTTIPLLLSPYPFTPDPVSPCSSPLPSLSHVLAFLSVSNSEPRTQNFPARPPVSPYPCTPVPLYPCTPIPYPLTPVIPLLPLYPFTPIPLPLSPFTPLLPPYPSTPVPPYPLTPGFTQYAYRAVARLTSAHCPGDGQTPLWPAILLPGPRMKTRSRREHAMWSMSNSLPTSAP